MSDCHDVEAATGASPTSAQAAISLKLGSCPGAPALLIDENTGVAHAAKLGRLVQRLSEHGPPCTCLGSRMLGRASTP